MENEIVLKQINGEATANSREVAERFDKQHKHVLDKIELAIKNFNSAEKSAQYFILGNYTDSSGKSNKEYLLTRDGFSLIVMSFTGDKAFNWKIKYIDAFNKMESLLKEQGSKALPTTYKEALIQLLETVEKNEQLEAENKVLLPKATYHDEVLSKDGLITTTLVAKDLGLPSAAKLNQVMFLNEIIYKAKDGVWHPYSKFEWLITDKYADYKSYEQEHSKPCLKWTELGRQWIIENYKEWSEKI